MELQIIIISVLLIICSLILVKNELKNILKELNIVIEDSILHLNQQIYIRQDS